MADGDTAQAVKQAIQIRDAAALRRLAESTNDQHRLVLQLLADIIEYHPVGAQQRTYA